ncbi:MAG: HlyD family efflux transporter periplasmic adaptor subunit, partial [Burkholderiales bacterium]|nr:HlyD family efflux transporter periplasmic adaptor subunit [Burkholderiales bacterium]
IEALGFVMVNETLAMGPYRQAALWLGSGLGQVATVSGLPDTDPTAPYIQWLSQVCRALEKQAGAQHAIQVNAASLPATLGETWADWLPAAALWLPLRSADDAPPAGGLLLARDTPWSESEIGLLTELAYLYGRVLALHQPHRASKARIVEWFSQRRNQVRVAAGVLAVSLVPVPLTVLAPAEIVPHEPFMVRAPLDGVVAHIHVHPNEAVKAGAPLFSLDTTALQSRYAVARKALDTAQEAFRASAQLAVTDDKGREDLTEKKGELEQRAVELDYTAQQLDRVQVKAERAGVAVFSDVNDWQGKAVTVGEKVLLLADPAHVEIDAWLPVADNVDIRPGASLSFYPKSSALTRYDAHVDYVAYRAEVTEEGVLAYKLKAHLDQPGDGRLGQMGTARIRGSWVPLAYYVLRRPLALVRQYIGW